MEARDHACSPDAFPGPESLPGAAQPCPLMHSVSAVSVWERVPAHMSMVSACLPSCSVCPCASFHLPQAPSSCPSMWLTSGLLPVQGKLSAAANSRLTRPARRGHPPCSHQHCHRDGRCHPGRISGQPSVCSGKSACRWRALCRAQGPCWTDAAGTGREARDAVLGRGFSLRCSAGKLPRVCARSDNLDGSIAVVADAFPPFPFAACQTHSLSCSQTAGHQEEEQTMWPDAAACRVCRAQGWVPPLRGQRRLPPRGCACDRFSGLVVIGKSRWLVSIKCNKIFLK